MSEDGPKRSSSKNSEASSEQELRTVLQIFDALSWYGIIFDHSGTIRTANKTLLDAVGMSSGEIAGMPAEILEPHLAGIKEQLTEFRDQNTRTFHARLTGKGGNAFFVELTFVQLEEAGRDVIACIGHDLHKLTSGQEAALRKTEQQLMAANRLKRKFIANINHAIRTPMNAIIGYAEILAESGLSEQQQRFVSTIRKNGTALVSIINDVMELSKLESGNVKVLKSAANLKVVVEQAADLFSDQIRSKKLEFVCSVEQNLPEMYVMDAGHCRQVLINLISNAVKFTERGKVSLAVSGFQTAPGWYDLWFRVTDTGVGMSPEEQQAVLELLEQQEEQICIHDGTRLGLTLCARLARMMGGSIRLESVQGQGSAFVFNMPAKSAEKTVDRVSAEQPRTVVRNRGKGQKHPLILVVDDMPEMSHLVKIYFASSPIKVLEADNRRSCLELAFAEQPDLILLDLDLAGVDGRDIARQLREDDKTSRIPIIAMTGLALDKESLKPLFDDFLAKPFHLQELQQLTDKYLRLGTNREPEARCRTWDASPVPPDVERLRTAWTEDLDAVYGRAQMSGNLEDALELGRQMEAHGLLTGASELTAMGREMKRFALDLDIRGVEQILTALRKVAGESR